MFHWYVLVGFWAWLLGLSATSPRAVADPSPVLSGTKAISLISADGDRQSIGTVTFTPGQSGASFVVKLDKPPFTDEFLSMRPFECISPTKRMWCHLPYPFAVERRVTGADLVPLEYALMFLWRPYEQVGVDAWNGLYFALTLQNDGSLRGKLHEVDFNILAVPPAAPDVRVIGRGELTAAEPGQHAFDEIEIR